MGRTMRYLSFLRMCGAGRVANGPLRQRIRTAPCSTSMAVPFGHTSIS
eukprot:COSAG04_NODE_32418_length_251_cov_0.684211_1_plen_47_part_01